MATIAGTSSNEGEQYRSAIYWSGLLVVVALGLNAIASLPTIPRVIVGTAPPGFGLEGFMPLIGVVGALGAIGMARTDADIRWIAVGIAGTLVLVVGVLYMTVVTGHWGTDFTWTARLAIGGITAVGGGGILCSAGFAVIGRELPSIPRTGLGRIPLVFPFAIALGALFGLSGGPASIASIILIQMKFFSVMFLLLIQVYRYRRRDRRRKISGGISGVGGLFVLLGLGPPGGCSDVLREGPFTVYYDAAQSVLHYGTCSTEPFLALFGVGAGLLILGPLSPYMYDAASN